MMDYKGETGVFMMYAYARCSTILQKVQKFVVNTINTEPARCNPRSALFDMLTGADITVGTKYEIKLVKKIMEFPDAVAQALENLSPHYICNYMYELASIFGNFYEHDRCTDLDEKKNIRSIDANRVRLTHITQQTIGKCMDLVGMEYVDNI